MVTGAAGGLGITSNMANVGLTRALAQALCDDASFMTVDRGIVL